MLTKIWRNWNTHTATRNVNGITVTFEMIRNFFKCKHIAAI